MKLRVEGAVAAPREFTFADLAALPQAEVATRIPGRDGTAVPLRALLEAAGASPEARYATIASDNGDFALSLPLADIADNALVAYRLGDGPLPDAKGGPARFYVIDFGACGTGEVDACANVKRLGLIRLTAAREHDVGHHHFPKT
ncbi:MAG TPA: molybdopterin-dependent oxidoreductase [bacterium]|nr:molybdopterin-dependent oxidoreductase [bacterium]